MPLDFQKNSYNYFLQKSVKIRSLWSCKHKHQQSIIYMNKVVFLLCLLCLGLALTQVAQSDTSASIVFPQGATAVEVAALNANYGSVIPGAKWIWANSVPGTGKKNVTFEILKYLGCTGEVTLTSAAFGKRYIYWDGALQGTFSNWQEASDLVITPKCGKHNLTIVVEITVGSGYAGLVFLLQQDRTNCYNCNSNGFWNEWTCQCECLTTACTCPSNKKWAAYPTCACKCPPRPIIFQAPVVRNLQTTGVAATLLSPVLPPASQLAINFWRCPSGQYYSEVQCSCWCYQQWCPPKYQFDADPSGGCGCREIIY